jgi:CRISPR-associated protein Cas2
VRSWHLVTYDIRDERRLRQVAKLMEGYGERVQYSIFRCRLTATSLERLRWELARITEPDDSVLFFPLCNRCSGNVRDVYEKQGWDEDRPSFTVV